MKKGSIMSKVGRKRISETLKRLGLKPPSRKGITWTENQKKNISDNLRERYIKYPNLKNKISEKLKGLKKPPSFGEKISRALTGKKSPWAKPPHYKGNFHYNWKGGITPIMQEIRHCVQYCQWRSDVFARDQYSCQECGLRGGWLEAHHLIEFNKIISKYKINNLKEAIMCEELWDINNGQTLCKKCHDKTKKGRNKL